MAAQRRPPIKPPRTFSEIRRKHEKKQRKLEEEREERQRVQRERQEVERELRRLSNERREIEFRQNVEQRNRQAMLAILAVVGVVILVGIIVGVIIAWRKSKKAKELAAQSSVPGGLIQHSHIGDAGSFAMYGTQPPQAFPQYQYQPQAVYSSMPTSPIDEKVMVPTDFSPSPSYEDAPPAYNPGPR
jgi:ABC-type multidrug transport system fused ATPase/permease subunit